MNLDGMAVNFSLIERVSGGAPSKHGEIKHTPTADNSSFRNTSSKTVIEEGKIIVEIYDNDGQLIRKTPP